MAHGDGDALAELYDRHAPAIYAHAVALARSPSDAQDLVQTVFVKVAGLGPALLGVRSAGAYLHQALRSTFLDDQRHKAIAGEEPLECRAERPAQCVDEHVRRLAIEAAVKALPAAQREAVWLHAVEGFTLREIAAVTDTAMWTVASRYRLGILRLRRLLGATP